MLYKSWLIYRETLKRIVEVASLVFVMRKTFGKFSSVVKLGHEFLRFGAMSVYFSRCSVCGGYTLFYSARVRYAEFGSIVPLLRAKRQFHSMPLYDNSNASLACYTILRFMSELDINISNICSIFLVN